MRTKYLFTIIVEKDSYGYFAYCPQLQGCYTQGGTYEEVLKNIEDAIRLHIEDRKTTKEDWREPDLVNVTALELAF